MTSTDATTLYSPGPTATTVCTPTGEVRQVPAGWTLVPPGDPALTRRVKAAGQFWAVAETRGRKTFSRGVWAPQATVEQVQRELQVERSDPRHARKREADAARRQREQAGYVDQFTAAVRSFLAFHPAHAELADRLAAAVSAHATPVGSGTVARTSRIPIDQRAEAAVIAWMRHQTTGYDTLIIPRVKGKRREVRRMLARRSHELLARYRRGEPTAGGCPLVRALTADPVGNRTEELG